MQSAGRLVRQDGLPTRPTFNTKSRGMNYYKRKLPHWQPGGAEYFITIRLQGSLPKIAIERLKSLQDQLAEENPERSEELQDYIDKKIFKEYEDLLDEGGTGPTWLKKEEIADLVEESIHYRNSELYDLYAYCIMPNHLHLIFKHLIQEEQHENPITDIMRNFKRYTARECNKRLNRTGAFWQSESYDRVIRDQDELENVLRYTLNNPVKAGLVDHWKGWSYTYCKPEFIESFT